nr:hypothetical protein [Corynebacterium lactis]
MSALPRDDNGRRKRRRAGATPKDLAESNPVTRAPKLRGLGRSNQDESPDDARSFDEDYWRSQRPPHWG